MAKSAPAAAALALEAWVRGEPWDEALRGLSPAKASIARAIARSQAQLVMFWAREIQAGMAPHKVPEPMRELALAYAARLPKLNGT